MGKRQLKALPLLDAATLMRVLALSRTHFYRLVSDGVIPRTATKNQFALADAVQGYIDYVKRGSEASATVHAQRLQLAAAQTAAIVQRTRERDGQLVQLDEAKAVFSNCLILVKAHLDGLPGRCAAELAQLTDPALVRHRLMEEVHRVEEAAAVELKAFASGVGVGGSLDAAPGANGRSMG
jgi:hypothetical protein